MEQLIKGKTSMGDYYVRPVNWAGIWNKEKELVGGNTLLTTPSEADCDIYIAECSLDESSVEYSGINECITNGEELRKLMQENPDLPIMYMCGEECYCDDFGYTINVGSFAIEEVTMVGDSICDDKVDLEEKIYCQLDKKYPNATEKLLDILTKEKLEKYVWKKVITVRLG